MTGLRILASVLLAILVPASVWAQQSEWSAKAKDAPGKLVSIIRLGGALHLEIEGKDAPARYYRIYFAGGDIEFEALPHFSIAPSERRSDMLPDGLISRDGRGFSEAWLYGPTRRYRHGALGDAIEASGIRAVDDLGVQLQFELPANSVFEDRYPRFVDLDGDETDEIIAVRSYLDQGAALAVLKVRDDQLSIVAETPAIGSRHRWLNPAGFGDFDGDGRVEVAIVKTPHIGGTLEIYELTDDGLRLDGEAPGFSNHVMGSRELGLSAILDADGDEAMDLAIPSDGRRNLRIVSFAGNRLRDIVTVEHGARINTAIHSLDLDRDGQNEIVYGLDDSTLVILTR